MAPKQIKSPPGHFKHVTMQDVAREAGVSKMTVSRVLAGNPTVDEKMSKRVLAAAKRLDYVPNELAINFGRNRSAFIGVAIPFRELLGTRYFGEVMVGFKSVITGHDFALFDCTSQTFTDPKELAKIYRQKKAGGIFLMAPRIGDRYLTTLAELGVPFIVVGEWVNNRKVPSISCDDSQGIRLLLAHLFELGHRRIAYLGGEADKLGSAWRREQAFRTVMHEAGHPVPRNFFETGNYTVESGRAAARRLWSPPVADCSTRRRGRRGTG